MSRARTSTGYTLVELLVALTLTGIMSASIYGVLNANRRLHRAQSERVELNQNVRAAFVVLASELRELDAGDPAGGDILAMTSSWLTYRAMRGIAFLCRNPDTLSLTITIGATPAFGVRAINPATDDLLLFAEGDQSTTADDHWLRIASARAATGPSCPGGTTGRTFLLAGITPSELAGVGHGAAVRGYEIAELALYADAGGDWWLGSRERDRATGKWSTRQPLAGPVSASGLELAYIDSLGAPAATPGDVVSVGILLSGVTPGRVRLMNGSLARDTARLATQVTLRNNPRP